MNSGVLTFATRGKAFKTIGTHQKFDREAYRLIRPALKQGIFPMRREVLQFEGMGGPDGLKFKGKYKGDHLWDPIKEIGHMPVWIEVHYNNLVEAIREGDRIKAAFEAGFMAHYLTDSLTPAHHLSWKEAEAEYENSSKLRKKWLYYGRKGLMSSHVAFEAGVSSTISFGRLKTKFDTDLYERVQSDGIQAVVKQESRTIAEHQLYRKFLEKGWNVAIARAVKRVVVPRIPQLIAAAWLSAYADAGYKVDTNKLATIK